MTTANASNPYSHTVNLVKSIHESSELRTPARLAGPPLEAERRIVERCGRCLYFEQSLTGAIERAAVRLTA
jgi:hypothetical protein